jgi:hypothetical protein
MPMRQRLRQSVLGPEKLATTTSCAAPQGGLFVAIALLHFRATRTLKLPK